VSGRGIAYLYICAPALLCGWSKLCILGLFTDAIPRVSNEVERHCRWWLGKDSEKVGVASSMVRVLNWGVSGRTEGSCENVSRGFACNWTEIWTWHLPSTDIEPYCHAKLFDACVSHVSPSSFICHLKTLVTIYGALVLRKNSVWLFIRVILRTA